MFSKEFSMGIIPPLLSTRASEVSKASRLALAVAGPVYRYLFRARYPTRYDAHPRKTLDGVKHTCAHRARGNGVRNEVNGTKRRREIETRTFLLFSTLLSSRETRRDRRKIGGSIDEWEDSMGVCKFNNNLRVNTRLVPDPDTSWENEQASIVCYVLRPVVSSFVIAGRSWMLSMAGRRQRDNQQQVGRL